MLGARSGDKAGNGTLCVWTRDDPARQWLRTWWSEQRLRELLPEIAGLELRLWELPLLRACGVTVVGFHGTGAAANHALDGQAKVRLDPRRYPEVSDETRQQVRHRLGGGRIVAPDPGTDHLSSRCLAHSRW